MSLPSYTLKRHPRSRGIRIRICADGSCVVTAPRRVPQWMIRRVVEAKAAWIEEAIARAKTRPTNPLLVGSKTDYAKLKAMALELAHERLKFFSGIYRLTYKKVSIRNQRTRWGSCNSLGHLCFNYRIVHLSPEALDYIIVHELCHLGEMNHSARFWALVAKTVPEHRRIRRNLLGGQ